MRHNLIAPFIMREAGLIVNNIPRNHTRPEELTNEAHSIMSAGEGDNAKLKTTLKLDGKFSYFETRKLHEEEIS